MLVALAGEAATGSCRIGIAALARSLGISRNTCRRYLDFLMKAGLVLVKAINEGRAALGYEARLIVDEDGRSAAIANGFSFARPKRADKARASQ